MKRRDLITFIAAPVAVSAVLIGLLVGYTFWSGASEAEAAKGSRWVEEGFAVKDEESAPTFEQLADLKRELEKTKQELEATKQAKQELEEKLKETLKELEAAKKELEKVYYEVKKGDSLWKIAEKFYKNPYKWLEIYKSNLPKIEDPNLIYPGQVFLLPGLKKEGMADEVLP